MKKSIIRLTYILSAVLWFQYQSIGQSRHYLNILSYEGSLGVDEVERRFPNDFEFNSQENCENLDSIISELEIENSLRRNYEQYYEYDINNRIIKLETSRYSRFHDTILNLRIVNREYDFPNEISWARDFKPNGTPQTEFPVKIKSYINSETTMLCRKFLDLVTNSNPMN